MTHANNEFIQDDGQLRVFIVPVDILEVPDLSSSEKLIYIVLRSYVNPTDPTAFPSYETIAKKASLKRRRTIDIVKSLVEKGLIKKEARLDVSKNRKIRSTSNMYTLITPKKQPKAPAKVKSKTQLKVSQEDKKGSAIIAPPLVQPLHPPSAIIAPYHNHLKEPSLNMYDCMSENTIYEALIKFAPKKCYISNGIPMSKDYVEDIYLLLIKQFPSHDLDPATVEKACDRYNSNTGTDIFGEMNMVPNNPVGYFKTCYQEAIELSKVKKKILNK